jgi:ABC-type nitrate/sulfonate/bicarbonate transport system substrate-binding protein
MLLSKLVRLTTPMKFMKLKPRLCLSACKWIFSRPISRNALACGFRHSQPQAIALRLIDTCAQAEPEHKQIPSKRPSTIPISKLIQLMLLSRCRTIVASSITLFCFIGFSSFLGCKPASTEKASQPLGKFSLAWSEYPSWSVFGVAHELGWIQKEAGKLGEYEKKWNVDIVLEQNDYDPCITMYGTGTVDAVCITNMDILGPADKRASVAILPTSTSNGADACVAVGVDELSGLKGKTTYGLERSVSQYCFERCLEQKGLTVAEYPFSNMDPAAAATALQAGDEKVSSIIVWNPFVMNTLRAKPESKVLFDSSSIPEEIIDMVVVAKDSLDKPGGKNFAMAILDIYYQINRRMADAKLADETLIAIGSKFSSLGLEDMKTIVTQTKFYDSPDAALKVFEGAKFQKETMPAVAAFCESHGIIDKKPSLGFNEPGHQVNFDTTYLKAIRDGLTPDKL